MRAPLRGQFPMNPKRVGVFLIIAILFGVWMTATFRKNQDAEKHLLYSVPIGSLVLLLAWNWASRTPEPAGAVPRESKRKVIIPTHPLITSPPDDKRREKSLVPIQMVRDLLGHRPREFDPELDEYLHADPPPWLEKAGSKDEMYSPFEKQNLIRRDGLVVWACVVQANQLAFQHGYVDTGASVIWSEDRYFDTNSEELRDIASQCYALKGVDQSDPECAAFSRMLTNELTRAPRLKVPSVFTGGYKVYHSPVMLTRRHLPKGFLAEHVFPVFIAPDKSGDLLLVPAAFWPPSLMAAWDRDH